VSKHPLQAHASIGPEKTAVTVGSSGTLDLSAIGGQRGYSPGELLLGALAGCLTLSLKFAIKEAGLIDRAGDVDVQVVGTKSEELPSRFTDLAVSINFTGTLTDAEKEALVERAEQVCTVTNTLHTLPTFSQTISA
jgi:uncharacterized OsmC-like protein